MALILPFSGDLWYIILSVSCHARLHRVIRGHIGAINVLNSCYIRTHKGLESHE